MIEEVDAVRAQARECGVADGTDTFGSAVLAFCRIAILEAKFGCNHNLIAHGRQSLSDKFLIREGAVCLRGVEEGDAALVGVTEQLNRLDTIPDTFSRVLL